MSNNPLDPFYDRVKNAIDGGLPRLWEADRCKFLLRSFREKLEDRSAELNFNFVLGELIDFPFHLKAYVPETPLHQDSTATFSAWLRNPGKVSVVREYLTLFPKKKRNSDGIYEGLVVPRKGLQQGLVIHDFVNSDYVGKGFFMFEVKGRVLVAQSFQSLVLWFTNSSE